MKIFIATLELITSFLIYMVRELLPLVLVSVVFMLGIIGIIEILAAILS